MASEKAKRWARASQWFLLCLLVAIIVVSQLSDAMGDAILAYFGAEAGSGTLAELAVKRSAYRGWPSPARAANLLFVLASPAIFMASVLYFRGNLPDNHMAELAWRWSLLRIRLGGILFLLLWPVGVVITLFLFYSDGIGCVGCLAPNAIFSIIVAFLQMFACATMAFMSWRMLWYRPPESTPGR